MDAIIEKINELLEDSKKLLSENKITLAQKNLETILVLDPNHEEAKYILASFDSVSGKIDQLLEDTKKLVSENKNDLAKRNLETILVLDPNHEEAKYVLSRLDSINKESVKIPNFKVVRKAMMFGVALNFQVYVDDHFFGSIGDGGFFEQLLPIGKHKLKIKVFGYRTNESEFVIKDDNSKIIVHTQYKGVFSLNLLVNIETIDN